jgi:hypothetical protein
MDKRKTIRDLKIEIFKHFRPLIPGCKVTAEKNSEDKIIEEEFKHYFESNKDPPLYTIQITNNLPLDQGMFSSSQVTCDFCGKNHKGQNCSLDQFNSTITLKKIMETMKYDRDLEITV